MKKGLKNHSETLHEITPKKEMLTDKWMPPLSKGILNFDEKLPINWLPSFHGKLVRCKTKLCLEIQTQNGIQHYNTSVFIHQMSEENSVYHGDFDSSDALKKTNPFLTTSHQVDEGILHSENIFGFL